MRNKLLLCLALVLGGLFPALSARAESIWTQLDSTNLNNQPLAFTIETKTTKDDVIFFVRIESKAELFRHFLTPI